MNIKNEIKYVYGSYKKAYILIEHDSETLFSYDTPIIRKNNDGTLTRLYDGWTATTGRHIKNFCGLNKKQFLEINLER